MTFKTWAAAALIAGFAATSSSAAVISVAGDGEFFGPAPAVVNNGTPTDNDSIKIFDEIQNYVLEDDLVVDGGIISAGRTVSSHMVFLNRVAGSGRIGPYEATFGFDGDILGVISTRVGQMMSDSILGAPGTDYFTSGSPNARGLENNDSYSVLGNLFSTRLTVTEPGDWVRVVTVAPIPLPAGAVLLPGALVALGAMRRRKAAKAA